MAMIDKVKMALRLSTDAYDSELETYIASAKEDLGIAGVELPHASAIGEMAIITYCRMHFGNPDNYNNLKMSYDEQKAQLQVATGYTEWNND